MKRPEHQREEKWIRMMLDEELDAPELDCLKKELDSDFLQKKRFQDIESVVKDVDTYYASPKNPEFTLTHEQKEELYSHITSVFQSRSNYAKTEWLPQLRFALAVMTGTAALVASVPLFEWIGDVEPPIQYSPDGILQPYEPPELKYLTPRDNTPMMEPVEIIDDIILQSENEFDPIPYELLSWQYFQMDIGEPNLDVPEFDFEESIVNLIDVDVPPNPVRQSVPSFPNEARRGHLGGQVIVEFIVDENGFVREPYVVSSNHRVFENSALNAIRKWQFEPGEKDGSVVKVRMRVPFVFNYRR